MTSQTQTSLAYRCDNPAVHFSAREVSCDSAVFAMKVWQIEHLEVSNDTEAGSQLLQFMQWVRSQSVGMISCRLPHDGLRESILLEEMGFRFIEMVLHPECTLEGAVSAESDPILSIQLADTSDIPVLRDIAEHAFGVERCHVDPRLDSRKADLRYGRWVAASLGDPRQ